MFSINAMASPRLHCQLDQGGKSSKFEFSPVADPYMVHAIDLGGRFRFKAVVIGDQSKIEYIKLYTYYLNNEKAILLHEVKYQSPEVQSNSAPASLTGINYIYSPNLERELQYRCALIEAAP